MTVARKALGAKGELLAREHLERQGMVFHAANVVTRYGELDLVMRSGGAMVFVEVKTRSGTRQGLPAEAVDWRKLRHITNAAQAYVRQIGHAGEWRIDVMALRGRDIVHLPNVTL